MKYEDKKPTIVCSAFVEKDGKFLLVFDPKFKCWRIPGGRPDWGEKLEVALAREMEEELNLKMKDFVFLGWGQDIQYHHGHEEDKSRVLMYFHIKTNEEIKVDEEEAEEWKWLTWEEIKNHDNLEGGMVDFLKKNSKLKL